MTIPQGTPLLLLSELRAAFTGDTTQADVYDRARRLILSASMAVQAWCGRRFDEYVATRSYTALARANGGDLIDAYTLQLDADLRALTSLAYDVDRYNNGAGTPITAGYLLEPENARADGVTAYDTISLDPNGATTFVATWVARNSIRVAGRWGYGGQWLSTGTTNSGAISDSAGSFTSSAGASLEIGMVLKIDSEYLYVDGIATNTITVGRGFNGSTAAAHDTGKTVYRWQAHDTVQQWIKRLCLFRIQQDKSPLAGSAVIGDFTIPVSVDGIPKDIVNDMELSGLKWFALPMATSGGRF